MPRQRRLPWLPASGQPQPGQASPRSVEECLRWSCRARGTPTQGQLLLALTWATEANCPVFWLSVASVANCGVLT